VNVKVAVCPGLERFRNYCGLIKVARSGFPWEKTTKGDGASVYTNCETALTDADVGVAAIVKSGAAITMVTALDVLAALF
jgi:hypothetical protein